MGKTWGGGPVSGLEHLADTRPCTEAMRCLKPCVSLHETSADKALMKYDANSLVRIVQPFAFYENISSPVVEFEATTQISGWIIIIEQLS